MFDKSKRHVGVGLLRDETIAEENRYYPPLSQLTFRAIRITLAIYSNLCVLYFNVSAKVYHPRSKLSHYHCLVAIRRKKWQCSPSHLNF